MRSESRCLEILRKGQTGGAIHTSGSAAHHRGRQTATMEQTSRTEPSSRNLYEFPREEEIHQNIQCCHQSTRYLGDFKIEPVRPESFGIEYLLHYQGKARRG